MVFYYLISFQKSYPMQLSTPEAADEGGEGSSVRRRTQFSSRLAGNSLGERQQQQDTILFKARRQQPRVAPATARHNSSVNPTAAAALEDASY
mmetsp:Transcript_18421/g.27776  ORF Transcript_18421/g.27776 Transcript_18421/m.27776 type:complete len:93 (+) Transcript_18421:328-606(+)